MRTRAFSSSSDEEENQSRPPIAPRGTLGAEARRLTAEHSSSSDENDKQSASAVSSCSALPKQNMALIVSEHDDLKERCEQLMRALETALAESEQLKRYHYVSHAVCSVKKIDTSSSRESYSELYLCQECKCVPRAKCVLVNPASGVMTLPARAHLCASCRFAKSVMILTPLLK